MNQNGKDMDSIVRYDKISKTRTGNKQTPLTLEPPQVLSRQEKQEHEKESDP